MNRSVYKMFSVTIILALMLVALPMQSAGAATPTELFFSEYVEGSSFNKAVEVYNGTGGVVDLSTYTIELYSNGAATPSQTVALSGTLADGDVFVIAHASADAAILAVADATSSSVINFNGDDALVLRNSGTVVDSFGQVGVDPGSEWAGGGVDDTLRRAESICAGDTNPTDAFDASSEWVTFALNTFDGLGSHTATCGGGSTVSDVFMSEYIEGSSFNKAIEIYNGTGSSVDLGAGLYTLELYSNGSPTASQSLALSGTIASGDVFVLAHASADPAILAQADVTNNAVINFNGDDAVVLRKNGAVVDSFGQIGFDPGTEWAGGGADDTLRRAESVCAGDTNPDDAFNVSVEWVVFATNTFDGLGSHTATCSLELSLGVNDISADEGNSGTTTFDFTVSLSGPAGPGGVTFDIATADDTATVGDNDYVANSLTGQTIPEGSSSYVFSVLVNGDTTVEPDETFFVNVTNVTGAMVGDGQGLGTILDDDTNICALEYTPIYDIQGSGSSAAITGNVTTQGVVVGDFEGPTSEGLQGFYLQDATGDGDVTTSDGIFVYTGNTDNNLSAGDLVRVSGFARERFNQTALNGSNNNNAAVTDIINCGTGTVEPVDVTMPFPDASYLEQFEGMLVRFPQALVISEYFNYDRFGEIVLGLPLDGQTRHFTPTGVVEPGADAQALAAEYSLRRITLDDGLGTQNPSFTRHPNGDAFTLDNRFRGGDTLQNTVGVIGFDFSIYRIQPTTPAEYTAANPRPEQPDDVGGNLKVSSFNVLNYFTTLDDGVNDICGPAGNQECRGADNEEEFERQRAKIIAALAAIDADVVGLIEIENHPGDIPTADLVSGLNDAMGAGTYDYIATGAIGTDAIRQAFIYKPATVTPVGPYAILDSTVDPRFLDDFSRPVLAQTFQDNTTGGIVTVAVNHLKSKGSDCNDIGDPDTGDGQGNCNLTRLAAAEALVDWLATDPTGSGDEDYLIIGDLNAYDKEDPIDAILEGSDDSLGTDDDYTDLLFHFIGEFAYSYVFDGQAGYLDHALAIQDLLDEVTGATVWHINADEPDLIDYDTSFKSSTQDAIYAPDAYRSSDHDPVIVGLNVCDEIAPTFDELSVSPDMLWPPNHKYVDVTATVSVSDNFDTNPTIELVSVTSNEPDDDPGMEDGNTTEDIVIVDDFNFKLRAERSDVGTGRIYTITYKVTDACGNSTTQSVTVTVPLQLGD